MHVTSVEPALNWHFPCAQACPICGKEVTQQAQGSAAAQERSSHVMDARSK